MSGIDLTLQTLRRTHLTLLVLSLGIGALALIPSQDYEPGLEEIRTAQDLVDPEVMDGYCRDAAESRFSSLWQEMGDGDASAEPLVGDDVEVSFTAYCPHPTASQSLAQIAAYLEQGLLVDVPEPADSVLIPYLEMLSPVGALEEAYVLWDTAVVGRWQGQVALAPLTDETLTAIDQGEQLLDVRLRYSGFIDLASLAPPPVPADDTTGVISPSLENVRVLAPGNVVSLRIPGVVNQSRREMVEVLRSNPRWYLLAEEPEEDAETGSSSLFPDLQPYWSDVSNLPPAEAALYLQSVAGEEEGRVEIAGAVVPVRTLGWIGPGLLAALLLYLLLHLQHLTGIVPADPVAVRTYPWIFFFDGPAALAYSVVSLALLPAAASGLLAYRLLEGDVVVSSWAGALALVSAAAAIWMLVIRKRLLQTLLRRRTRTGAPRPRKEKKSQPTEEPPTDPRRQSG